MVLPVVLLSLSGGLAVYALLFFGPVLSDLLLLALVSGGASLLLVYLSRAGASGPKPGRAPDKWPTDAAGPRARARRGKLPANPILVDGSNVLHWRDEVAQIATVRQVVETLVGRGFSPGVMFDANVGYKIGTRYLDDADLAVALGLPADRVLVVPKGIQADTYLLKAAGDLGARVVTNDRFRDWAEAHPQVREAGFLIRGGFRDGVLWLDETPLTPQLERQPGQAQP